jgi:hypothetical protein
MKTFSHQLCLEAINGTISTLFNLVYQLVPNDFVSSQAREKIPSTIGHESIEFWSHCNYPPRINNNFGVTSRGHLSESGM